MGFIKPTLPTVEAERLAQQRRLERIRELAPFWVENGFGTHASCTCSTCEVPGLRGRRNPGRQPDHPGPGRDHRGGRVVAGAGLLPEGGHLLAALRDPRLGCGSGPLTLRINPPIGASSTGCGRAPSGCRRGRPGAADPRATRGPIDVLLYVGCSPPASGCCSHRPGPDGTRWGWSHRPGRVVPLWCCCRCSGSATRPSSWPPGLSTTC